MRNVSPSRTPSISPQHSRWPAAAASRRICPASAAGRSMLWLCIAETGFDLADQMPVLGVEQVYLLARGVADPQDQPSRLALHVDDARAGRQLEGRGGAGIRRLA